QLTPSNLTAYVVNSHTLSVTWDLPSNVNAINKIYITVIELGRTNRTIQAQEFDNTIKKLDIQIDSNDPFGIHPNRTIHFSARCSDRNGQNSSIIEYQLYVNMLTPPKTYYAQVPRSSTHPSPRDIRVVRINDTTIQVFWLPIYHPPVERYIVHYNDKAENKPENQWALYSPSHPSTTTATISGLKPDAMYNVRVSAEFSANIYERYNSSGTERREGDLSEIHVADIYH
ncbi:unnamed protein product, partial [Rotaria socialis]